MTVETQTIDQTTWDDTSDPADNSLASMSLSHLLDAVGEYFQRAVSTSRTQLSTSINPLSRQSRTSRYS